MAQLLADGEARLLVGIPLRLGELRSGRPTSMWGVPAGQFLIPLLGVGMAQAVHFRQPGIGGVALVDPELLDVLPAPGDQGP